MYNGIDIFISTHKNKGARFGILTNHASLSANGIPVALELLKSGFSLQKIFSPEHGVYSQAEDGREQPNGTDLLTELPVVSLYGNKLSPDATDLCDIDVMLIDLPNIGCRFYTYQWSISYMLEECSAHSKEVWILDRPNQRSNNTHQAEGPLLDEKNCSSFLGRWQMPVSHGLSYGQLFKWFVHSKNIDLHLQVIGYKPENRIAEFTVPPSPAISNQQTIWLYPFSGLFEGVSVSVGRGTSFPFCAIGAPWINPEKFLDDFRAMKMVGLSAYPYAFKPIWSNYAGEFCYGLYFKVEDSHAFLPVTIGLALMRYLNNEYEKFKPVTYSTWVNPSGEGHLDRLLGIENAFDKICMVNDPVENLSKHNSVSDWTNSVNSFLGL